VAKGNEVKVRVAESNEVNVREGNYIGALAGHFAHCEAIAPCHGAKAGGEQGLLSTSKGDEVRALLREHGATFTLHEECKTGNVAAIAQLLDGGADIEAEDRSGTPLRAAAAAGSVPAARLLLERGAKADGESGAAALRAAKSDEVKALLRAHGAVGSLLDECTAGNVAGIAKLLDGGANIEAPHDKGRPTVGDTVPTALAAPASGAAAHPPGTVLCKNHPDLARYFKLLRMNMPAENIKQKMSVEEFEPSLLDMPDAPMPADPRPGMCGAALAAAAGGAAGAMALLVKDDPQYKVYFKMVNMGVPTGNIKLKMQMEGADPAVLDMDPNAVSPNA
jgi:hypothetical protein